MSTPKRSNGQVGTGDADARPIDARAAASRALTSGARRVFETPATERQIQAFQAWEQRNVATMLLRYNDLPVGTAFGLRSSDVLTLNPEIAVHHRVGAVELIDLDGRTIDTLTDVEPDLLRVILAQFDGQRSLAAILATVSQNQHAALEALVRNLLGVLLLNPVVARLEAELPAIELLRFPHQSSYAMPREYWQNALAVRDALPTCYRLTDDVSAFSTALRGLHRLATIGADGETYYGGAGGIATRPGEYRRTPLENRFSERKKWIIATWMRLLGCTLALVPSGTIRSINDVPLLQVAEHGDKCLHPYGDRGEFLALQVNEVRAHLDAALTALESHDAHGVVRHCALFHHSFCLAHPFNNINNSIAMNIVNDLLRRADIGVLPHLYFDQVAYFMRPETYLEFFGVALRAHVINEGPRSYARAATENLLEAVLS